MPSANVSFIPMSSSIKIVVLEVAVAITEEFNDFGWKIGFLGVCESSSQCPVRTLGPD